MKKITPLFLGFTAIFALAACNGKAKNEEGKEVKAEEFTAAVEKIEDHEYSEATVKYSLKEESSVPNTGPLTRAASGEENETGPLSETLEGEAKFTFSNGSWVTDDEEAGEAAEGMVGFNIKAHIGDLSNMSTGMEEMAKQYGVTIGGSLKYFVEPFGIEFSLVGSHSDPETHSSGSVNIYEYMAFDSYGFLTKLDIKMDLSSSMTYEGQTLGGRMVMEEHFTISYK